MNDSNTVAICASIIFSLTGVGIAWIKFARDDRFKQIEAERASDRNLIGRLREEINELKAAEHDCKEERGQNTKTILDLLQENRDLRKELVVLLKGKNITL